MLPLAVRKTEFAARRFLLPSQVIRCLVVRLCDAPVRYKRQGANTAKGFGLCVSFSPLSARPAWKAT